MDKYRQIQKNYQNELPKTISELEQRLDDFKILFAYHSGKIENEAITYHDAREIFENGKVLNFTGDPRTIYEVENQKLAFDFLKAKIVSKEALSIDLIKELHRILTAGTFDHRRFIRNAAETMWELCGVNISTWTVSKAVSTVADLIEEREQYRYFEEKYAGERKTVQAIWIDADGVMLRTNQPNEEGKYWRDYAHLAVHFGMKQLTKKRWASIGRVEFFGSNLSVVRQQLIDYIYNHYDVSDDTLVVTNSDGGHGYSPQAMRALAQEIGGGHHEHFWDRYHVQQTISEATKKYPEVVAKRIRQAIKYRKYNILVATLDLMGDSLEGHDEDKEDEVFQKQLGAYEAFRRKMIRNWPYTASPHRRGLKTHGISFIESNHRKITYRTKNRGMYWSERNAIAIAQLIIMHASHQLEELFYGDWRKTYAKYHELDSDGWYKKHASERRLRGREVTPKNIGTVTTRY